MKKILTLILVLALSLTVMVGCDKIPGLDKIKLPDFGIDLGNLGLGSNDETPDETPDATPAVDADLQAAYDYVHQSVKTIAEVTGANYTVPGAAAIGDKNYNVEWTVSDERVTLTVDGTIVTVNVPKSDVEFTYTLTFKVTNEKGETLERTYNHTVPKFVVATFEEYMAAEKDANVTVMGVVVAINSKSLGNTRNHLFLADLNVVGGYYSYQMDQDPVADLGIEVGMTVTVNGPIAPYSGMQEIKGGVAEIISTEKKTVEFLDVTEDFAAGVDFAKYTALPVVIKGVTIDGQELGGTSDYLKFSLNGRTSYVRSYKTDFPTTLAQTDKETIEATHAANFGNTADVYGLVVLFNGNPYLIPMSVDCFTNFVVVEKTAEEKVAAELAALSVASKLTNDTVLELAAVGKYYDDVTLTWACESEHAVLADGKLTVTIPETKATVTLTVTVTCEGVTETKSFEITLSKEATPLADAIAIGAAKDHNTYTEEKYLVAGVITQVYNTTYGNMYITDAYGNVLTIYGAYDADGTNRYDAMTAVPVAGDYVVILGSLGQYSGTVQIKNGWIQSWTSNTSLSDAIALGTSKESNDYSGDKILVTGTITEVYNTTYGNMYLTDAEGNTFTIYGAYDSNGVNRYDAMTAQPVAGDTVTIYGNVGNYNGAAQIKNGWIVYVVKGSTGDDNTGDDNTGDDNTGDDNNGGNTATDAPAVDTAYKFGMIQQNLENQVYYLAGGMNGYYMDSTTNINNALDVYLEATEGGYYFYCYVDGTKTYINMVVSGTHVNGAYEATASTVYRYDETSKTLLASIDGVDYWFGTRNDKQYTTIGPCAVSYAGFYCLFYNVPAAHDCTYEAVVTAPTCTAAGFTTYTCTVCADKYTADEVAALGHTTDNGTCDNCGATIGGTTGAAYTQVTSAEDFTSGTYVIALADGTAIGAVDGTWVTAINVTAENGVVTNDNGAVLTIVVNNGKATIQDKNGTYIGAKGGNANGISTNAYEWDVVFNDDGTITFAGTGSDTVYFAYNSDAQYLKFRGYKTTTCEGDSSKYPYSFVAYKLG